MGESVASKNSSSKSDSADDLMVAIVESSYDAVFAKTLDGTIVSWNAAAQELLGYRKEEILGRHGSVLAAPGHEGEMVEMLAKIAQGERIWHHESLRKHKDNSIVPVSISVSPIRDGDGRIFGASSIMRSVAEVENSERFRLVVEAAPNGMIMVDSDGIIVLVNSQIEKMFGYRREELIGTPIETLVPERFRDSHPAHRQGFMICPSVRLMGVGRDLFARCKDGSEIPVEIGLNPILTEGSSFVLASIIDISERKRSEELVKARDEAISLSKVKSAFIANVSHELRTPLSSIIGMNDLFLLSELSPEQKEMAEAIREASQSLLSLVNDILDLARIEAGKLVLKPAPLNIQDTVQQCVKVLSRAAQAKKLKLFTQIDQAIPGTLIGDAERIQQVLTNLVGNAIKFTETGEVIVSVTMESTDEERVMLRFAVKDSGIGIGDAQLALLFKPFVQVDTSSTRRFGGTGLGLSICKNLVESLGGEIGAESTAQNGSTFYFTVPLSRPEKRQSLPEHSKSSQPPVVCPYGESRQKSLNVLVVEDNNLLQIVVRKQLEKAGMLVTIARSGVEACTQALGGSFDLILMDLNIPEMDGIEATIKIREAEKVSGKHTPIIAMTAAAMKGDLERCLAAGMDDYLSKPVMVEDLLEKLKLVMERES